MLLIVMKLFIWMHFYMQYTLFNVDKQVCGAEIFEFYNLYLNFV